MSVYLERLYHLRDVVIPLAEECLQQGRLCFDIYYDPKTEQCCLLGIAVQTDKLKQDGWHFGNGMFKYHFPGWSGHFGQEAAMHYYKISSLQADALFGPKAYICGYKYELDYRKTWLDMIIKQKERSLYEIARKITGAIGRVVAIDEFTELCRRARHRDHGRTGDVPHNSGDRHGADYGVPQQGEIIRRLQSTHTSPSREEESIT